MNLMFEYDRIAEGNAFLSRHSDVRKMADFLQKKKNVSLYTAAKTGKQTLVHHVFETLKSAGYQYTPVTFDLFNICTTDGFYNLYAAKLVELSAKLDKQSQNPLNISVENLTRRDILDLPEEISKHYGVNIIVYFKEFHNLYNCERGEEFIEEIEVALRYHQNAVYIFTSPFINLMKLIFEEKRYFFGNVVNIIPRPISRADMSEYIHRSFQRTGRVIEMDMAERIYDICSGHPWYTLQLASICYSLTLGYINDQVFNRGVQVLLSMHEYRYRHIMSELTENQINFIKAVVDGIQRFSSSEILNAYHLNSSANVFRLKDSFKKKELVTFEIDDRATVIDPLFKYWLKNHYFA
ncbi:MAG: hypothetical protein HUJ93_02840 [Bacteroidales bacterium]|nr:hypothetical protein [Bacteroidales bacterium]